MRRLRRAVAGACAITFALVAAACGLPSSGPVEQGLQINQPAAPPIKLGFEAPRPGASPEQIVLGFLAAQWSADDGYRAARAYLTPDASQLWRPRSVVVYPGTARPETAVSEGGSKVTVAIQEGAALDSAGRFSASPVGTTREVEIGMEQVFGEWRIASLPDGFGLWLSQFYFDRAYRQYQVAYVSRSGDTMVPDWRRFAVGPGLTTSLARALLDPAPEYLAPAVISGFPAGTELAVDAVPVAGAAAQIDLTPRALAMDATSRRAAWAQALRTMRQVPEVTDVSLMVDGRPLDIGGFQGLPRTTAELGFQGAPALSAVVLRRIGDALEPISSTSFPRVVEVPDLPSFPRLAETWTHVAVSADLGDVAAVSPQSGQLARWVGGASRAARLPGTASTPPAYDHAGYLWVGGKASDGTPAIWVLPPAGVQGVAPTRLVADWLKGRTVLSVKPAPEGFRAVVLSKEASGRMHLDLAGVERDDSRGPLGLGAPWAVGRDIAVADAVAWIDDHTLGVVGSRLAGAEKTPLVVPLGANTVEQPPVPGLVSLVSLGGDRGLVGVTTANEVVRRAGSGWQSVGSASDVIVPAR
ncbi:MAG: LpqB family beta-propeller domain-containing protein [Dermatophilus congolensis]|nr:LpqB family beta-propeller domain-containing protein [Dermatophilus congolensis]